MAERRNAQNQIIGYDSDTSVDPEAAKKTIAMMGAGGLGEIARLNKIKRDADKLEREKEEADRKEKEAKDAARSMPRK